MQDPIVATRWQPGSIDMRTPLGYKPGGAFLLHCWCQQLYTCTWTANVLNYANSISKGIFMHIVLQSDVSIWPTDWAAAGLWPIELQQLGSVPAAPHKYAGACCVPDAPLTSFKQPNWPLHPGTHEAARCCSSKRLKKTSSFGGSCGVSKRFVPTWFRAISTLQS